MNEENIKNCKKLERILKKQIRIVNIIETCSKNIDSAYWKYLSDFMTEYYENKEKISELEKDLGL
jgi:ferritin